MTITIHKGDILGATFVVIPAWLGLMVLLSVVFAFMVGERPRGFEWFPVLVTLALLSAVCWCLWEAAHWFAA